MPAPTPREVRELVLVGAGHAHVQVLRRFMMDPPDGVRVTVVVDRPEAAYSGMVPGFVARDYEASELEIDAVPLARRAGAAVVLAPALRVDARARRIELPGRPALPYDVASLNVGSSVRGLYLPGVGDHALATRPIRRLVDTLDAHVARARDASGGRALRVVVVGAGAAGVELAFTLSHRLGCHGVAHETTLVAAAPEILPGQPARVGARLARLAGARGIRIRTGLDVRSVEKDCIRTEGAGGAEAIPADLVLWATGAAPPELIAASGLPASEAGYVRVRDTLQVVGHDELFAVGDCALLEDHAWMPRAGVHAVREGPVLERNLRAQLAGRPLRRHRPQRDFLTLLNLGGGRAFGAKWGRSFEGTAVFRLKDWIDRRFMRRFQVLDAAGDPRPEFPSAESMGMEPMECGGCAAKVGARPLDAALSRLPEAPADASLLAGLDPPDDAAVLDAGEGRVTLATVDAFRAFTDDPWLVGRVAAVNAVSDLLAKGGRARHALALVTVPEAPPARETEQLFQVLSGVRAALDPLGISLVGGHTTRGDELFVGLSVTGEADSLAAVLPLAGAQPGDALVLTKPLGTGVVLAADMQGRAAGAWLAATIESMLRHNAAASGVARARGVHAATDVSGFALAGHLDELLAAGGVGARLALDALPLLPGAARLFSAGLRSSVHEQNVANSAVAAAGPVRDDPRFAAIFDPQTSGGLLFAVAASDAEAFVAELHAAGDHAAAVIGEVVSAPAAGPRIEIHGG